MDQTTYHKDLVGPEPMRHWVRWSNSGFFEKFLSGQGVDVGYGKAQGFKPILPNTVGFDIGDQDYDGLRLPCNINSLDYVFSSHMLEHVQFPHEYVKEWWRKLKVGGHMFIVVPHKWRYEGKEMPPSRWNEDHKIFFMPSDLLKLIENCITPMTYEIVHFRDNADNYNYNLGADEHPAGAYDIEVCIKKIATGAEK